MGQVFRPQLKSGRLSDKWAIRYYLNGKRVWERGFPTERKAEETLKKREGTLAAGLPLMPGLEKITYEQVREDLRQHYTATKSRDLKDYGYQLRHLDPYFAGRRIAGLSGADATAYTVARQGEGAADGTIRKELAVLNRMLTLAYEHQKLARMPILRKPKDGRPRQGFLEPEQFAAVSRRLPPDLQAAVAIGYVLGWRLQEVLTLERRQLDLEAGVLRLDPDRDKEEDGRVVWLTVELRAILSAHQARLDALQRKLGRIVPYLFPHMGGTQRAGQPRRDYRKAWATACKKAGIPGALRHDMRRSAVKNMVTRDAVPERVAMQITGHKTRRVFDCYHIVSPQDLQEAARKMSGAAVGAASLAQGQR